MTARWADSTVDHSLDWTRSEEHTSELQSHCNLVCRLLLENKSEIALPLGNAVPVRLSSPLAPAFKSLIAAVPNGRVPAPHTVPFLKMGAPEELPSSSSPRALSI